ncbi:two-component system sensor histidine kinase NtrB [Trichlorobacter ammonificans]|uniref:histidine kinase n=1 Tax=Trichlorobacter ammonificans TaxID=2916410 RepID=A0ABM9D948_9BACT|nr:PAS domain-containing hybrid sensor histidine kinase/response regulator [Trichlorobacter ammonificans]CAH2031234.1 putative Histidine kinase [Trichlorobacter ammonificans]
MTPSPLQRQPERHTLLLRIKHLEEALQREKVRAETIMRLQADELRKTRDYYLTLLENFPALIWRANNAAHCDYFNTTWLTFTGRTLRQELDNGWIEGVHPDDVQRCQDTYLAAFTRRQPFVMEYRLRRHDGEYRTIRDHGAPLFSPDGAFSGYLGSCYDIHDQKMLEERLRHSQKMESIGILAGGVAHDFNNILSIILGYGGMLLLQTPPATPAHEQLTAVVDAALRASKLTGKLLAFSRQKETAPERVCLGDQVEGFDAFLHQLAGKQVTIRFDLQDRPLAVNLGRGVIEQILINLTVNARDAMPEGGELTISTDRVVLDELTAASLGLTPAIPYARLRVVDTGCGITPDILPKVFDPFFTTKGVGKGSGLGLSLVYGVVRQHGGTVTIASRVQEGTTVTIHLPLAGNDPAEGSSAQPSCPLNPGDNAGICC